MDALVLRSSSLLVALLLATAFRAASLAASAGSPELRLPPDMTYSGVETSPGPAEHGAPQAVWGTLQAEFFTQRVAA
jgi:hypothetical protein